MQVLVFTFCFFYSVGSAIWMTAFPYYMKKASRGSPFCFFGVGELYYQV